MLTCSMSRPRAARSVAMRTAISPSLNLRNASSRCTANMACLSVWETSVAGHKSVAQQDQDCFSSFHGHARVHVLYTYLSERPETAYSRRTRNHNKFLINKTSDLGDRHCEDEMTPQERCVTDRQTDRETI